MNARGSASRRASTPISRTSLPASPASAARSSSSQRHRLEPEVEISRNVQPAAHGTQQVSSNVTEVQRGASETELASSQVLSAAQSLSGDSNRLKLEVDKFFATVRAA